MLDCLNSGRYYALSCSFGTFDKLAVEKLLKIHYLKDISACVKRERQWLEKCVTVAPPNENCEPPNTDLQNYKDLIFLNGNEKVVYGKSVLSSDLANLTCNRWLNMCILQQFVEMLNQNNKITKTFLLNNLIWGTPQDQPLFCEESVGNCRHLSFILNVGMEDCSTFLATPQRPGCHWTVLYVNVIENTLWYIDTLGWAQPKDLVNNIKPILDAFYSVSNFARRASQFTSVAKVPNTGGGGFLQSKGVWGFDGYLIQGEGDSFRVRGFDGYLIQGRGIPVT